MEHIDIKCSVSKCRNFCGYWIAVEQDTFYLCSDHAEKISPEMDIAYILDLKTGIMTEYELGIYSCDEECEECN